MRRPDERVPLPHQPVSGSCLCSTARSPSRRCLVSPDNLRSGPSPSLEQRHLVLGSAASDVPHRMAHPPAGRWHHALEAQPFAVPVSLGDREDLTVSLVYTRHVKRAVPHRYGEGDLCAAPLVGVDIVPPRTDEAVVSQRGPCHTAPPPSAMRPDDRRTPGITCAAIHVDASPRPLRRAPAPPRVRFMPLFGGALTRARNLPRPSGGIPNTRRSARSAIPSLRAPASRDWAK